MIPKISVIVPVYNNEDCVAKCLSSILTQSFLDFELLLVNDGSTDQSMAVLEDYHKKDKRIYLFSKKNGGQSSARNVGLDYAKGEYISFVDADDTIEEDFLELLYNNAVETRSKISVCGVRLLKNGDDITPQNYTDERIVMKRADAVKEMLMERYFLFSVCDKLYHRCVFENLRFEEGVIHEDILFPYEAAIHSQTIVFQMLPKYNYFLNDQSTTGKPFSAKRLYDIIAREKLSILIANDFPSLKPYAINMRLVGYLNIANALSDQSKDFKKEFFPPIVEAIRHNFKLFMKSEHINRKKKIGVFLLALGGNFYSFVYKIIKRG